MQHIDKIVGVPVEHQVPTAPVRSTTDACDSHALESVSSGFITRVRHFQCVAERGTDGTHGARSTASGGMITTTSGRALRLSSVCVLFCMFDILAVCEKEGETCCHAQENADAVRN